MKENQNKTNELDGVRNSHWDRCLGMTQMPVPTAILYPVHKK